MDDVVMWEGRSVFVTGGNGFLGSHLVRALIVRGAVVTVLISEVRPFVEDVLVKVRHVRGDVRDLIPRDLIQQDVVFHLAARPIVGDAVRDPGPMFDTNVRGTYNLLDAARKSGVGVVICVTSDKVYGNAERLPYVESDRLNGLAPYEASKVCADVIAQSYAQTWGMPIGIARLGNLYGPGDVQWSRIVPGTIRALLAGERPVIRSDGEAVRDYFYVEDAAQALITLATAILDDSNRGGAFNFGTGQPTSVREIVKMIVAESGTTLEPIVKNEVLGEIRAQYLDCRKAKRLLGWESMIPLWQGLKTTWKWYEERRAEWT